MNSMTTMYYRAPSIIWIWCGNLYRTCRLRSKTAILEVATSNLQKWWGFAQSWGPCMPIWHPLVTTYSYFFFRHQTFRMNSMTTMTTNNSVSRKVSNKTVTSLASSFNGNHVNSSRAKNCSTYLETPLLSSGEPTPSRNFVWDQCTARIFLPKEKKGDEKYLKS